MTKLIRKVTTDLKTKTAKGALYLAFSEIVFVLSGYLIHIFLARKLGPSGYGTYSVVVSLVSIANLFLTTGIPKTVSKFISENKKNFESVKKSSIYLQLFFGIIFFNLFIISSKSMSFLLKDASLEPYIKIVAIMIPAFSFHSLFIGYLNGLREYEKQAISQTVYYFSKIILIFILVYLLNSSIKGALLGFALSPLLGLLACLFFVDFRLNGGNFPIKKIILFSLPITFFSVINNFALNLDLFFVKALVSNTLDVGYYSAASTIAKTLTYATVPISSVIFPVISNLTHKGKSEKSKIYIEKSFLYSFLIVFSIALLFSIFSKQIVSLLYSGEYLPATNSLKVLSFGMAFFALYTLAMTIISGAGKLKSCIVISSLVMILDLVLCSCLVKSYALVGAATATAISGFFGLCLSLIFIYRNMLRKKF
jgi:stage V sporulation protein B